MSDREKDIDAIPVRDRHLMKAEDVRLWIQRNCSLIEEDQATASWVPHYMMPVFEAGVWLGKVLEEAGADEQECEAACFSLGQRACMAGAPNSYRIAAECYNCWVAGHKDTPGRQFAEGD